MMDSCRVGLNASKTSECRMDQQYEDILLQALLPKYESIWSAYHKR